MESKDPKAEGMGPTPPEVAPVPALPALDTLIAVPLPSVGATIIVGPPPGPGSQRSPDPDAASVPGDLTAFFLNTSLLDVFGKIGLRAFTLTPAGTPALAPRARAAVAVLMGADLAVAAQAAAVDKELAGALAAYERYLQIVGMQLSFVQQVRVLLRDNDAPNKPIP